MQRLISIFAKTPKIEYEKPDHYKTLNKYEKDGLYLVALIKQTYPRLQSKVPDYDKVATAFLDAMKSTTSDLAFEIELKKFLAKLEDGHSHPIINFSSYSKNHFQFSLYQEKGNWLIKNVERSVDSSVIGKKVKSINGLSMEEIERRVLLLESGENSYWKRNMFSHFCVYPTYWKVLNMLGETEVLNFVVEDNGVDKSFSIQSRKEKSKAYQVAKKEKKFPFRSKQNGGFYFKLDTVRKYAYLQMNTCLDLVAIKADIDNYANFISKPIALMILKKKMKNAQDFGKTLQALFKEIHKNKIDNLIIDLSYNTGGSMELGKQLIWYLTENDTIKGFTEYLNNSAYFQQQMKMEYKRYNTLYKKKFGVDLPLGETNITKEILNAPYFESITKEKSPYFIDKTIPKFKGKVYTITSATTFSAGQILATTLSDNHLSKTIGMPTGNKPSTQTGASGLKLPKTKRIVMLSFWFAERPDTDKNHQDALYPNVEIQKTFDEYVRGEDEVMEYILEDIKK